MSDKENGGDKQKKSRSLGAFVLFLTVLVAILIVLGRQNSANTESFTHDLFEWHLYRGDIATVKIGSGNTITGQLRNSAKSYEVEINGLDRDSEQANRYRALNAAPSPVPIPAEDLATAIESGAYRAELTRTLRTKRYQRLEGAPKDAVDPKPEISEELFVRVLTNPSDEAERARFPMPSAGATLDLRVEFTGQTPLNLASTVALLRRAGSRFEQFDFDITKGGGTSFTQGGGLLQQFLFLWAPWILIFLVIFLFMRQMRAQGGAGGVMSFGRSRAQLYTKENHTNVTFDDVAGAQEAKEEVREVVEFLKNPSRFTRIGGRIPRGVLLVGPPGCGKTLLAKAIAGEAEVPFFSISGSDFVEMFVGVGASRVRDLFKQARENSPCIIFLDEIDAVGRRRGSGMGGGHDEREQTLNAILVEMDGFGTDEGIIVIAATNRPDVLDPALLRPGRFDREVTIDLPDFEGREEILRVHLKKVKCGPDAEPKTIAKLTPGYSGADLAAIINEAAIRAGLGKKEFITLEDLDEAREKVRYGRQKKSRKVELEDKKITAYHEAGHTVVAATIPEVDDPHKVSIVPRGRSLGVTWIMPDKESYHMQKKRMIGQLALAFGGRAAEEEFCGDISAGAFDDIKRATEMAKAMVTELGMSERIGPINYAERQGSDFLGTELMRGRDHSEQTAREIDEEVRRLLTEAHARALAIVREKRPELERIASALLLYETLNGDEIARLFKGEAPETLRPPQGGPPPTAPATTERKPAPKSATEGKRGDLPGTPGFSPA
ncbi:MAG: ATP-dependent zinc metalloprotease FtsH [Planctomycetes bacterium]|nr:ATP-dependent zinc metalloprotease FtsH [Planctomycetota bacterium]